MFYNLPSTILYIYLQCAICRAPNVVFWMKIRTVSMCNQCYNNIQDSSLTSWFRNAGGNLQAFAVAAQRSVVNLDQHFDLNYRSFIVCTNPRVNWPVIFDMIYLFAVIPNTPPVTHLRTIRLLTRTSTMKMSIPQTHFGLQFVTANANRQWRGGTPVFPV